MYAGVSQGGTEGLYWEFFSFCSTLVRTPFLLGLEAQDLNQIYIYHTTGLVEMFPLLISLPTRPQGHGCFSGMIRQNEKYRPTLLDHSEQGGIWNEVVRFGVF